MADAVVFASGRGSNFEAVARALQGTEHRISALVCDRKAAGAFDLADKLNVPSYHVSYYKRDRAEAEAEIFQLLDRLQPRLIILAGFMRLLSPEFVRRWQGKIINIHPSLLPKYPGTDSIRRSYEAGDEKMGITIHYVDKGMDTGPVICQKSFNRSEVASLEEAEARIHQLEHIWYPETVREILEGDKS